MDDVDEIPKSKHSAKSRSKKAVENNAPQISRAERLNARTVAKVNASCAH